MSLYQFTLADGNGPTKLIMLNHEADTLERLLTKLVTDQFLICSDATKPREIGLLASAIIQVEGVGDQAPAEPARPEPTMIGKSRVTKVRRR